MLCYSDSTAINICLVVVAVLKSRGLVSESLTTQTLELAQIYYFGSGKGAWNFISQKKYQVF